MRPLPLLETLENRTLLSAVHGSLTTIVGGEPSPKEGRRLVALAKHDNNNASERAAKQPMEDKILGLFADSKGHRQNERAVPSSLDSSLENGPAPRDKKGSRKLRSASPTETPSASTHNSPPASTETSGQPLAHSAIAAENAPALGTIAPSDRTVELAAVPRLADTVFLDALQGQLPTPQPELAPAADKNLTILANDLVDTPPDMGAADVAPRSEVESAPTNFFDGLSERAVISSLVSSLENGSVPGGEKGLPNVRSASPTETPSASTQNGPPASTETAGQPLAPSAIAAENAPALGSIAPGNETVDLATFATFADNVFFDAWQEGLPAPQAEVAPAADKKLTIIATYLVAPPPAKQAAEATPPREMESGPTDFIVGLPDRPSVPPSPRAADDRTAPPTLPVTPDTSSPPPIQSPTTPKVNPCNVPPDGGKQRPPDQQPDADSVEEPEEIGGE